MLEWWACCPCRWASHSATVISDLASKRRTDTVTVKATTTTSRRGCRRSFHLLQPRPGQAKISAVSQREMRCPSLPKSTGERAEEGLLRTTYYVLPMRPNLANLANLANLQIRREGFVEENVSGVWVGVDPHFGNIRIRRGRHHES